MIVVNLITVEIIIHVNVLSYLILKFHTSLTKVIIILNAIRNNLRPIFQTEKLKTFGKWEVLIKKAPSQLNMYRSWAYIGYVNLVHWEVSYVFGKETFKNVVPAKKGELRYCSLFDRIGSNGYNWSNYVAYKFVEDDSPCLWLVPLLIVSVHQNHKLNEAFKWIYFFPAH